MSRRVLLLVTHLMGNGHLVRTTAIARACQAGGLSVRLVSGGAPIATLDLTGLDVVQLPPLRSDGLNFRRLLDEAGQDAAPGLLEERAERIAETVRAFAPDAVVTELWPFGRRILGHEFERALLECRRQKPDAPWFVSVRDALVAPSRPERLWEVEAALSHGGARILVHGDADVLPLGASWPLTAALSSGVAYTGYVTWGRSERWSASRPLGGREIVVSGGGGVTSVPLLEAAAEAARADRGLRTWRLLAGAGVPEEVCNRIGATLPPWARLEPARSDFRGLLAQSALSISQFGYNTAMDLLVTGCRGVVVPFETEYDREQRLRADAFAARGWVRVLPASDLSGPGLLRAAIDVLEGPPPPRADLVLDGAERTARLLGAGDAARRGAA